jgi:hypothetical protein
MSFRVSCLWALQDSTFIEISHPSPMKLPHVIKEGFIHKEGHNIRKMKKRYFKLLIDLDCNPVLEYYDELDTDRRLGLCNLSASTMNKPKNSRPPFVHCLRIDLIDHAMNAFVKLVLGWESQAELDDWVQAFKTASTLITAHRQGSLGTAVSGAKIESPQMSERNLGANIQHEPVQEAIRVPSSSSAHLLAATSPVSSTAIAAIETSSSSQSPGGAPKSYQRRGSITVGNNAAAEKREQEKIDAEAEKRVLIEASAVLSSSEIENLIAETERNLEVISSQERFNPRKQTLEDVLVVLKEKLAQILRAEKMMEDEIILLAAECQEELRKSTPDSSLPTRDLIEIQKQLARYLALLQGHLQIKATNNSSTKVIEAYKSNIECITARIIEVEQFEQLLQSKLKDLTASKLELLSTIGSFSAEETRLTKSRTEDLLLKETNPEIREILGEMSVACSQKLETEVRLDAEAVSFVQLGVNLKKYARDKVIKKSKHEPVPSVVKCLSGSLIWGSHKTGPAVHCVSIGPSDSLLASGILGPRLVKSMFNLKTVQFTILLRLLNYLFRLILVASPNKNLHFHVSVSDGSSNTSGRETVDFVRFRFGLMFPLHAHSMIQIGTSPDDISKCVRGLKKLIV